MVASSHILSAPQRGIEGGERATFLPPTELIIMCVCIREKRCCIVLGSGPKIIAQQEGELENTLMYATLIFSCRPPVFFAGVSRWGGRRKTDNCFHFYRKWLRGEESRWRRRREEVVYTWQMRGKGGRQGKFSLAKKRGGEGKKQFGPLFLFQRRKYRNCAVSPFLLENEVS